MSSCHYNSNATDEPAVISAVVVDVCPTSASLYITTSVLFHGTLPNF